MTPIMDTVSREKRSQIMRAVHSKHTGPENIVQGLFRRLRIKYRCHSADFPGHPDFFLPEYKVAVFVHGCFWHGHKGCKRVKIPTSNRAYWSEKIRRNARRDRAATRAIRKLGVKVFTIWECRLSKAPMAVEKRFLKLTSGG